MIEVKDNKKRTTTQAKDSSRGISQGSPLSPLLSNCYFRRFLLAWKVFGHEEAFNAKVVNYADDSVICCNPGTEGKVLEAMRRIIHRMGLTLNEAKNQIA